MTPPSLAGQIGRASAIIMIWAMVDKILAVGKEMLTAHRFGVSGSLDVFNLAYSFPGIIVLLFSEDLIILLLKRGAFDLDAARQTAQTLVCYSLGLFFYAYTHINGTFFIALQNTKVLIYMGIVSIFLNVLLNFLFMNFFGVQGIALSTSATMGIISIWFIFLLKKKLGITNLSQTFSSFSRMILAVAGMLGTALVIVKLLEFASISRLISVPIAATASSLCYLGIIWVFRTEDLNTCIAALTNKMTLWEKSQ